MQIASQFDWIIKIILDVGNKKKVYKLLQLYANLMFWPGFTAWKVINTNHYNIALCFFCYSNSYFKDI